MVNGCELWLEIKTDLSMKLSIHHLHSGHVLEDIGNYMSICLHDKGTRIVVFIPSYLEICGLNPLKT
jgi:hypothetical protein